MSRLLRSHLNQRVGRRLAGSRGGLLELASDPSTPADEENADAHRDARGVRRDARQGEAGGLRLPGHQRQLLADAQRRARRASPTPAATASSRSPPAARSTSPARPSRTWSPARSRSRRTPPRSRRSYPVNIALHTDHCPKDKLDGFVRPLLDDLDRAGEERPGPAVPVAHVGRVGRTARGEPADRPGAARAGGRREDRPRDRGRRGRRRGGRRRGRLGEQALQHHRGRAGHRRGARHRREGPLHDRADLRQRARRLQARQRQAAPGDPQEGAGGGRREARPRRPAPSRSTWSSTAAPARRRRRSPPRVATA